ncbi:hypothetical protein ABZY19_21890 [Streptomyces sp. NPDC006475]|uniref:hypothetical protein n=1 Tax=Streptomyces sp. NPDC006475 TaxID=3155719 RepID=UPI0033AD6165
MDAASHCLMGHHAPATRIRLRLAQMAALIGGVVAVRPDWGDKHKAPLPRDERVLL